MPRLSVSRRPHSNEVDYEAEREALTESYRERLQDYQLKIRLTLLDESLSEDERLESSARLAQMADLEEIEYRDSMAEIDAAEADFLGYVEDDSSYVDQLREADDPLEESYVDMGADEGIGETPESYIDMDAADSSLAGLDGDSISVESGIEVGSEY